MALRKWKRKVDIWVRLTSEQISPGEQALRLLEKLDDEAALELEEADLNRFDCEKGVENLIDALKTFEEHGLFRKADVIRQYENIKRKAGEQVHAYIRRFVRLERLLGHTKVEPYPEDVRTLKLIDSIGLDERSMKVVLTSAGTEYNFERVVQALDFHYPASATVTGARQSSGADASGGRRGGGRFQRRGTGRGRGGGYPRRNDNPGRWKRSGTHLTGEEADEPLEEQWPDEQDDGLVPADPADYPEDDGEPFPDEDQEEEIPEEEDTSVLTTECLNYIDQLALREDITEEQHQILSACSQQL